MNKRRHKYSSNLTFLIKGFMGYIAYISIFPTFLPSLINKIRGVNISHWRKVYIAPNVLIDSIYPELVTIEDGVYITRGCKIISHFNPTDGIAKIIGKDSLQSKVVIKKEAFIGVNSIILPGVTVGAYSIVGAGSVVTKDVEDYAVVGGNPAIFIKDIREVKN